MMDGKFMIVATIFGCVIMTGLSGPKYFIRSLVTGILLVLLVFLLNKFF